MLLLTEATELFPPENSDYGTLVVELLFYAIAFALWCQTLALMWKAPITFFKSWWNIADLVNYTSARGADGADGAMAAEPAAAAPAE